MWASVILGTIGLNIVMFVIHYSGPKAIVMTWVPGRIIIFVLSMLNKTELRDWLQVTWSSSIIPVSFLAIFHFAIRCMKSKGRLPRFSCAFVPWTIAWSMAIITLLAAIGLCMFIENPYIAFSMGIFAIYLNIVNVLDAPERLQESHIKFTAAYILSTNAIVVSILVTIDQLIERGYVKWAGVVAHVPILSIILLSGGMCTDTESAIRTITQHIYMLAYQTWPSMAFIGVVWGGSALGTPIALTLASISVIIILLIQYTIVKTKL